MSKSARTDHMPAWQNRIVGYVVKPASQFLAHPLNFRRHPKAQQEAVVGSLNDLGWIDVVLENVRTGHLIDGHERIFEALAKGDETPVPCIQIDIDESEEPQALLMLDPIAAMAQTDRGALEELLREVQSGEAGVQAMLGKLAADAGIVKFDPMGEWGGMPEFGQEDKRAFHSVLVHFDCMDDVKVFAELIEQTVSENTTFIWFPQKERMNLKDIAFDES